MFIAKKTNNNSDNITVIDSTIDDELNSTADDRRLSSNALSTRTIMSTTPLATAQASLRPSINRRLANLKISNHHHNSTNSSCASNTSISFPENTHPPDLLDGLNDLRLNKKLCDVILVVDKQQFYCHKNVLAATSPYFRAMFTGEMFESSQSLVTLNGVDADAIAELIEYAYTAEVTICEHNVQSLLSAANFLQIQTVRESCCRYFERFLDETNAIGINCFAELHNSTELMRKAKRFILKKFSLVVQQEEFINVSAQKLIEFIKDDDIHVICEDEIFDACLKWLNYSLEERAKEFHHYSLMDKVATCKVIQECSECRLLLDEAVRYHLLVDRRTEMNSPRLKPRTCTELTEILVFLGGEDERVVVRGVEVFNPDKDEWKKLQCLPFAVSKHSVCCSGGTQLYLAGGDWPDGHPSSEVWKYEQKLDTWIRLQDMLTSRSELGLALIDNYLYAVGGWDGSNRLNSIERYCIESNCWTIISQMQIAVTSPSVCALKGFLYIIGGTVHEEGDGIDLVQRFDPKTNTWTQDLSSMKIARSGAGITAFQSQIFICGGWHASESTNKVEVYDSELNEWKFVQSMRERRYRPGVSVVNGKIYVCGGQEHFNKYHDSVEAYSTQDNTWTIITELICGRSWLACATLILRWNDLHWDHNCEGEHEPPENTN
ncbi:unnamed protein product [Didymodactylos carnosus]|uniref:BTB domain-containing protein n=1 Tax=Didymodactylos carnosus TaxID=1234261 RepID=A0A814YVB2_9BILA|nr:unnamed protein product [Didymodactylos carnosus]CAF1233480.1 unnamed protein product [Didymodactylos carnosus]CAF3867866.1 unnamed protein product [Didymodactylos carnosus]CAF3995992.1 unnamed protein product [Didymodactylos carnosus]